MTPEEIARRLGRLSDVQRAVLTARCQGLGVREIAARLGYSEQRIYQLEITDVNNAYVDRGLMEHDVISGFWGDCGESIDVYYQVVDEVRRNGANRPAREAATT